MTTLRVTTFNVNQFSRPDHQRADLTARMKDSDVLCCQETVDLDLVVFAAAHPGWSAFQVRHGDNDGHANTGILYRTVLGPPTDTSLVSLGKVDGAREDQHTRERFLAAVKLDGVWFGSFHVFPLRDKAGIPGQLDALKTWVGARADDRFVLGADRNQCPPGALERATGLDWHGVGIDGFLTDLHMTNVAEFPKGFSDHPGVHATVTMPEERPMPRHRVKEAQQLLGEALKRAVENGKQEKAGRIRKALHALSPVKKVPRKTFPAIAAARAQSHDGPRFGVGLCLQRVRICYGIGPAAPDAISAWNAAKTKRPETDPKQIPRGFPVFWRGGAAGHGHVAIAAGDGKCWSTDIERPGFFDFVDIGLIHERWGLTLLGYTEDLNGTPIRNQENR